MNRRPRHLNPYNLGCQVAYSAHTLTAYADNAVLTTWTGRDGTGHNATNGTAPSSTLWRNAANGINGMPAASFNGAFDWMTQPTTLGLFRNAASGQLFCVVQRGSGGPAVQTVFGWTINSGTPASRMVQSARTGSVDIPHSIVRRLDGDATAAQPVSTPSTASPCIVRTEARWSSNTAQAFGNGVGGATQAFASGSGNVSNTDSTFAYFGINLAAGAANQFLGKVGAAIAVSPALNASTTKRLEHSLALSFKIACS